MNSVTDIDDYDSFNFHYSNKYEQFRPLQLTTKHQVYKLLQNDKEGSRRQFVYANTDDNQRLQPRPVSSPRSLLMLCVNNVIQNDDLMQKLNEKTVSKNVFNLVFSEAVLFGELSLIAHLISIWPSNYLKLNDLISKEIINSDSLTKPLATNDPTVLDYVLLGALIKKKSSRLKTIDFTGFHRDLKLTKEICHLALLWIKPQHRTFENIYNKIKSRCFFDELSLKRYLDNFNEIYQEYDRLIEHEANFDEINLIIDCHVNCEDVTLGLALQYFTPFKFHVNKVWCSYGLIESEYSFKNYHLLSLINPNYLTHLCLKDLFMIDTPQDILNLCSILEKLNNLEGLALIRVLNFYPNNYTNEEINQVCQRLNKILIRSYKLKKIDLSYNFISSRLASLLRGMMQPIEYLNLQDCRLDSTDISFLNTPNMLKSLRTCKELNLSMNDFSHVHTLIFNLIGNCIRLNCLDISHCKIQTTLICQHLVNRIILSKNDNLSVDHHSKLKVIYIQPFLPPKMNEIIEIITSFCQIKSLQKLYFLPSPYAFPGSNAVDRETAAIRIIKICFGILKSKGRSDIEFIDL